MHAVPPKLSIAGAMMAKWRYGLLGFAAVLALAAPVHAASPTNSDVLTGFNAITSGNFSTTSESEGPVLVGGNLGGSNNANIQSPAPALPSSLGEFGTLNVIGSVAGAYFNLNSSNSVKVATPNPGNANFVNPSSITYNAPIASSYNAIWSQMTALSTAVKAFSATPGTTLSGNTLTATPATVNGVSNVAVLNTTTVALQGINQQLNLNLGSTNLLIINVDATGTGGSYTLDGGANFNLMNYAGSILWNFYNASTLTLNREIGGTILAPSATVYNNSPIDGTLVAQKFVGNGELHYKPLGQTGKTFVNSFGSTPVPEPASMMLLGSALAGLGLLRRRR